MVIVNYLMNSLKMKHVMFYCKIVGFLIVLGGFVFATNVSNEISILKEKIDRLTNRLAIKTFPDVKRLSLSAQKRILVTGGAGFVGSHLVDRLMRDGHSVVVMDNFFTGRRANVAHWLGHAAFELLHHDVVDPIHLEVDEIYHLASPASPRFYMYNPIKTLKTNTIGTINMLGLAKRTNATLLLASTSEVYGDPKEHPQRESYFGNVNPIGPRSCYDEGKRAAEALCYAYARRDGVRIRVARIFNTYGERMQLDDGRVVSNFIVQALKRAPITIYGDGRGTRSLQYVSDLVVGLVQLMNSKYTQPVNLGNPTEFSITQLALIIRKHIKTSSPLVYRKAVKDDPRRRRPDISIAKKHLKWSPTVSLNQGLRKTISYFRSALSASQ